jgi:DNA-binding LacI/PurR family transcriptional regulator
MFCIGDNLKLSDSKKRITIKDVADVAGVSTQTVSRVINNFSYVSTDTRQRVKGVIEDLGYLPSLLARSLSQQRSYTLGVVVFGLKYIGPSQALKGIADAAEKLNYMLLMKMLDEYYDAKNVKSVIDSLISRHVDGIIWTAPEIGESHVWLKDLLDSIPVPINFLAMEPREGLPSISINNYEGAVLAVQHLLDIGRKKIAHISGPLTWWVATERKRGWRDTLEKAGLSAPDHYCAEGNWSPASGERAFLKLYEAYPDMDAVFVANDQMALSVLREAHRLGIDVPEQLAVVGFDNIVESAFFCPSLTTVLQDQQLIGEVAVNSIVEMIQAVQENLSLNLQSRFITPTLIIRESSGSFDKA